MLFNELAFASNPLDKGFRFHFQYIYLWTKVKTTPIFTMWKVLAYEPRNKCLTDLMSQNKTIYADSVQFDIHKDSVFICILSENDNNFETRYGVLTPKLEEVCRILLNHNITEVTTENLSIHVVSDFLKRKCIQPKTQVRLNQNASAFKLKHKCIWTKT